MDGFILIHTYQRKCFSRVLVGNLDNFTDKGLVVYTQLVF